MPSNAAVLEARVDKLEVRVENVDQRVVRIESKLALAAFGGTALGAATASFLQQFVQWIGN